MKIAIGADHAGYAMKTLAEMGPAARPALPELLKLARNESAEDPVGWTAICDAAREQRFSWELAARRTIGELYGLNHD